MNRMGQVIFTVAFIVTLVLGAIAVSADEGGEDHWPPPPTSESSIARTR